MNRVWPLARLLAAGLILAAIIAQLSTSVAGARTYDRDVLTTVVNFVSFFTIQSNIIAVVTLAIGATIALRPDKRSHVSHEPAWFAVLLAAASTYMIVTGLVYNTLLRGVALPQGTTVPWSNEILHVVAPLFLLTDVWCAPRRRGLSWKALLAIAAYPVAWVAYTLARGPLTVSPVTGDPWWYPYPFLDPHTVPGGYLGVAGYVVGIAVLIMGVAALVVWWGRRRAPASFQG